MVEVADLLLQLLVTFGLGLGVRIVAVRSEQIVYPVALVLIGELISPGLFFDHARLIVGSVVLVLVARAAVVYPLMTGINHVRTEAVPRKYQHVIV